MNAIEENNDIPNKEPLSRGLVVSLFLHGLILTVFAIKAVFFTSEAIDFTQAVRVDLVALPEKVTEQPAPEPEVKKEPELPPKHTPEPEKKPTPKAAETKTTPPAPETKSELPSKTEDAVNLDHVKSKQKNALEKLKAMAAMEKFKEELSKKPNNQPKFKGNVLSPGTALTGLSKLQHETYASTLDVHIKQNWSLPEWLAKREFRAQARVYIDAKGNILDRKIVKTSGNTSYDDAVLQTIDRSAPFPAPPEKFVAMVSVDGILIGFPE